MSTNNATVEKAPAPKLTRVPPEEQFWKRYSPHGEAPLSLAGSVTAHALVAGGLIIFGVYLAALFFKPTQSLPVEPVRIALGGGNGPGSAEGVEGGKGVDGGPEKAERSDQSQKGLDEAPPRPNLDVAETKMIEESFDADARRFITQKDSEPRKAFARLNDSVRRKLSEGLQQPGKGSGGTGSGGSGTGTGTGSGAGSGDGKATLSKREKRMLRWHMRFTANSGPEYLAQLRGLGAILAFPVTEGADPTYKIVRNLRPGQARLEDEDMSKIHQIYWIDDKPRSVEDIVRALGLRLPQIPSRFVAFMPVKLEEKLFQMERNYVERVLRQPFNEDRIGETVFRAVRTPSGYKAELISVTMNQ